MLKNVLLCMVALEFFEKGVFLTDTSISSLLN